MADDITENEFTKDENGRRAIRVIPCDGNTDTNSSAKGREDTNNSSIIPLAAGATFTGVGTLVSIYATITVFLDSNLDGSLSMEFSSDNVNWDRKKVVPNDLAISSGSVHTLETVAKYFRVVYTNGSSSGTQSHFRLQTLLHSYRSGFLTSSPDEIISKINDAQIVRVSNDALLDISRGLYKDKVSIHKFGYNEGVPNGSFADIWSYGDTLTKYPWPTTAETLRVRSGGDVNDTLAGTGARVIFIKYLDAAGVVTLETINLAGASASGVTSVAATRFARAWVDSVGTFGGSNIGRIIIENSTSNQVLGAIEPGVGESQQSHFTVSKGFTGYLTRAQVGVAVGTNKDADVRMYQRRAGLTFSAPFGPTRLVRQWNEIQGANNPIDYKNLPTFPEFTDFWFEARGNGAVTAVDIDFDLICIKDEAPTTPQ